MRRFVKIALPMLALVALVVGVVVLVGTSDVLAKGHGGGNGGGNGGGGNGCPRTGIACADVWDPVICDDGVVYSNGCYAYVACATGCQPYGDGGPVPL